MVGSHLRFLPVIAAMINASVAVAADAICRNVADANAKIYTIPTHIYSTETAAYTGGKIRTSELIYLNNKTYIQVNGKWRLSPVTQAKMRDIRKETEAENLNMTCRVVRDEAVGGEAASLYSMHQKTPDATIDSQMWISKSRGVPLKLEMDMDVGGAAGKSHKVMRYEYTNVQAPAGVQ